MSHIKGPYRNSSAVRDLEFWKDELDPFTGVDLNLSPAFPIIYIYIYPIYTPARFAIHFVNPGFPPIRSAWRGITSMPHDVVERRGDDLMQKEVRI